MRTIFWMSVWLLVAGCSKEDAPTTTEALLQGYWKITSVSGGFSGQGYIPAFSVLYFPDKSHYQLLESKALLGRGSFALYTENGEEWIRFTSDAEPTQLFESAVKRINLDGDNLILSDPCCDQYVYQLARQ